MSVEHFKELPVEQKTQNLHSTMAGLLTGQVEYPPPRGRQIFVNRSLRMDQIEWIGFDMDYTLANYKPITMENLVYDKAIERLLAKGYPESLTKLAYDPQRVVRGVVIDKQLGNLLKMDRHRYVGTGYHGYRPLGKAVRQSYKLDPLHFSKDSRFYFIDTLYAVPEACLYCDLVALMDQRFGENSVDYFKLFQDVRQSMDEAHALGLIQQEVLREPERYLERDPNLWWALSRFRMSGKHLFLLTNSDWQYTQAVMSFLLDHQSTESPHWRNYLDLVVVNARKPDFFLGEQPLEEITSSCISTLSSQTHLTSQVFQGGNQKDFNELLGVPGDRVLYVGDHIYGDILRSKKSSSWRTMMVMRELEDELARLEELQHIMFRMEDLEKQRIRLDSELSYQWMLLEQLNLFSKRNHAEQPSSSWITLEERVRCAAIRKTEDNIQRHQQKLEEVLEKRASLKSQIDARFNGYWGMIFKEDQENSYLGGQIRSHACLYTGRVTNFIYLSPLQYFRPPRPVLPHEMDSF